LGGNGIFPQRTHERPTAAAKFAGDGKLSSKTLAFFEFYAFFVVKCPHDTSRPGASYQPDIFGQFTRHRSSGAQHPHQ
jgi:hypothetical protein